MSSRFSAQDYDHRPLSSPRSLVDLSHSHTPPTRARSGSLGAQADIPTRSTIRINTDLTPPRPTTTTAKPDSRRSTQYVRSSHARSTSFSAPVTAVDTTPRERLGLDRPPTTNYLHPQERADLIRKSRKLTQLFGETPSPQSVTPPSLPVRFSSEAPLSRTGRHSPSPHPIWASRSSMRSADSIDTIHDRLVLPSPIDALSISELSLAGTADDGKAGDTRTGAAGVIIDDDKRPIPFFSPSSPQLSSLDPADSMLYRRTPEEDRRRRREKVTKLHRFLGSRVPTSLVLGFNASDVTLPALDPTTTIDNVRTSRHTRRRSSSATETRSNWFGPDDRMKEELDEREKAINVRRAIKMEKMFGVQPPQTLYHTRPKDRVHSPDRHSHCSEREAVLPANRNVNQSSYLNKDGKQNRHRASSHSHSHSHSHSESMPLLDPVAGSSSGKRASAVYMHYRYSLNSLGDIIDRDDRESLAELHSILTNDHQSGSGGSTPVPRDNDNDDDCDDARTIRSERRRSLPTRSSTVSLASQFSLGSPSPERTSFQARRRQAAKLTHFFGVDYRDLIGDILESIEHYVEEESHRGTLHPEEIQDLVVKLRNLRTKRTAV
ncbi:hypothetical protein F5888DRAFT_1798075 [Russula emetica]|nr:hypothetical protein F5888DRAFT_1798075 [Russula emetica]